MKDNKVIYNIIFAGGSVPPMIGALVTLANGYETYAYIERGRLYNGIEKLDGFYNIGFDTDKTKSIDKEPPFVLTSEKIRSLRAAQPNSFFNLYTNESRALRCAAVAANAGLKKEDFHIYMMEDGIDTYKKMDYFYGGTTGYQPVRNLLFSLTKREWFSIEMAKKAATLFSNGDNFLKKALDNCAYKLFKKDVRTAESIFEGIMLKKNHRFDDPLFLPNYHWPFPLSCLDSFTYLLQSGQKVESIIGASKNPKLMKVFGINNTAEKVSVHTKVVSQNIPQMVAALNVEQREKYNTLIFDRFKENLGKSIGRTRRAEEEAPGKKLVYISSRLDTMFIHPATDKVYGTGGITGRVPRSYQQLGDKYKTIFIFPSEKDYNLFTCAMDLFLWSSDAPAEMIAEAEVKVFNIYTDYIFTAKLIHILYGESYDIIVKNHPMTDIGNSADWREYYRPEYGDGKILDIGGCLDAALQAFHKDDSLGRYIGYVNGGVSTENFEYLGLDISFAGQPSSVYNGLSDSAQIPFIISDTDMDISGGDTAQVSYSAVSGRYLAGNMNYIDKHGIKQPTVFLNTGNTLRACSKAAAKKGDAVLAEYYDSLFSNWLARKYPQAADIDSQGFAVL